MGVPETHPRRASLELRDRLIGGFERGIVASAGLFAHGRGEAFDYLLGEKTHFKAAEAENAAAAMLLAANKPAISVNGNVAALCPREVVELAEATGSRLEVNLFYRTAERMRKIRSVLLKAGARKVWGVGVKKKTVGGLDSERAKSDRAILEADVVLVMLEDGDRTEKLVELGKRVIAVDLNPLSRTAQKAQLTVVDNVARALPNMIRYAGELKGLGEGRLKEIAEKFDNKKNLKEMEGIIRSGFRP